MDIIRLYFTRLVLSFITSSYSPFLKKSPSINMNLGLSDALYASMWFDGYASILQPFSSNTVSLLSKVTCSLGSNNSFILFMSLIAMSMLGPVTVHIVSLLSHYSSLEILKTLYILDSSLVV